MSSDAVVVMSVRFQNPAEVRLAQNDDVIQTLAPDRSDQPFGKAILPRRGWCSGLVPDAHSTQSARDDNAIDSIPISDHIARSHVPRKSLGYLTCNPLRRRVGCDVNPNEISTIQPHDDERIKQIEANGRDNEQVHGGDLRGMITQKGAPSLAWETAPCDHVFGDARLRDLKPELEQFAVNTWRSPKQILRPHLPDQRTQFRLDRRSPSPSTRLPKPIAAQTGPQATDPRFGSNNQARREDRRGTAVELHRQPHDLVRETRT